MDKFQRVLNAAERVVTGTWKFDSGLGQILHDELHWLGVPDRVFFKLAVTVLNFCSTSLPAQHILPSGLFSYRFHSLELSRISSGTRPSVQTVSDVFLKRACSLDSRH